LRAPFAAVWTLIWELDPNEIWLSLLLNYNFEQEIDSVWDEPEDMPAASTSQDFSKLVAVLLESARKGILSPNAIDTPNGGRAVLTIAQIQEIEEAKWGILKEMLLEKLPSAYGECPSDFWQQLAITEPTEVVLRFLPNLFAYYNQTLETAQLRWQVITDRFEGFSTAVMTSLNTMLTANHDPKWLTEVVQADAGFTTVEDGTAWFQILQEALINHDFSKLPAR
jgi:hypothetical protein